MSAATQVTVEPATLASPAQPKRRRYSIMEKRRIVEETFEAAASVARVARAHSINANQVFSWRRLYQRGRLGGVARPVQSAELLPVTISEQPTAPAPLPAPLPVGAIQLHLPRGRLRIEGSVDPEALRLVLQCMLA